jgi:multidrug efflux pump subunit AcrA (membrane-fusion protein)
VTVGERVAGKAVIRDGLALGDEVVVEGMARLRDGAPLATSALGSGS